MTTVSGGGPQRRTDRGSQDPTGNPRFTDEQRLWLLERDMDVQESELGAFRGEVRRELQALRSSFEAEAAAVRRLVTSRLNWIVGLGFTLLISVVVALITAVVASS